MKKNHRNASKQAGARLSSMPASSSSSRKDASAPSIASLSRVAPSKQRPMGQQQLGRGGHPSRPGRPPVGLPPRPAAPIQDWNRNGPSGELPLRGHHQSAPGRRSVAFQQQQQQQLQYHHPAQQHQQQLHWAPVVEESTTIGDAVIHVGHQPYPMSQLTQHSYESSDPSFAHTHYSGPPVHQNSSQGFESSQSSCFSTTSSRFGGRHHDGIPSARVPPTGSLFSRLKPVRGAVRGDGMISSNTSTAGRMSHHPPPQQVPAAAAALRHTNLTPAQKLLHMGTTKRRVQQHHNPPSLLMGQPGHFPNASQSVSSIVSNGSHGIPKNAAQSSGVVGGGDLLLGQQDAQSTSGTQGSFQTTRGPPTPVDADHANIVDRDELIKALKEELTSHFEAKLEGKVTSLLKSQISNEMNDVRSSLQDDLSSQVKEHTSMEVKDLRSNLKDELMTGVGDFFSNKSSELDDRMKDLKLSSKNEVENHSKMATKEFQALVLASNTELQDNLEKAVSSSTQTGLAILETEGRHQRELIKSFGKSWITKLKESTESATASLVKTCQDLVPAPVKRLGSLLQGERAVPGAGGSSAAMEVEDNGRKTTRTISPAPTKMSNKRSSPRAHGELHSQSKRHRPAPQVALPELSQETKSTIESSITLETRGTKRSRSRRTLRAAAEIAPLELRTTGKTKSSVSPTGKKKKSRNVKAKTNNSKKSGSIIFSQDSLSTMSATQYEAPLASSSSKTTLGQEESKLEDDTEKENNTPASLKVRDFYLITPLGSSNRGTPNHVAPPSATAEREGCTAKGATTRSKRSNRLKSSKTTDLSMSKLKSVPENKISSPLSSSKYSSEDSIFFPLNEIVTENKDEICASPLSTASLANVQKSKKSGRDRRVVPKRKGASTRRQSSSRKPKVVAVTVQRGKKKTYSKRPSGAQYKDDLTFSFASSEPSSAYY